MTLLSIDELDTVLSSVAPISADLKLASRGGGARRLNFEWDKTKKYLVSYCKSKNDCPDGNLAADCTHFICHALNKGNVYIANPSASCKSSLGINARELATSFKNSVSLYDNVMAIDNTSDARAGDFAFIPSWFGLDYDHAMVLAGPITERDGELGSKRWQHTGSRCGDEWAAFGADVVVFRITE